MVVAAERGMFAWMGGLRRCSASATCIPSSTILVGTCRVHALTPVLGICRDQDRYANSLLLGQGVENK